MKINPASMVRNTTKQTSLFVFLLCRSVMLLRSVHSKREAAPQGNHYTIYLADRTSLSLKAGLTEKLHIEPCFISCIL
jgi:hypothetical protein